jgi:DNA-binding NarL/FixJ family response regulator
MPRLTDIAVLVADARGPSRTALAGLIAGTPGLALAATASTLAELVAALRSSEPDVVLLDDRLLRDGGLRAWPFAARLVITGMDDEPAYAARAREIGAAAWVAKERVDALIDALRGTRAVAAGRRALTPRAQDCIPDGRGEVLGTGAVGRATAGWPF